MLSIKEPRRSTRIDHVDSSLRRHETNVATFVRSTGALVVLTVLLLILFIFPATSSGQKRKVSGSKVPGSVLLRIVRAEDERRYDDELISLLANANAGVRERAALAAGRIGDERAVPVLISLLQKDINDRVRTMAAFALGEIESSKAIEALVSELDKGSQSPELRGRVVEALGKICGALPKSEENLKKPAGEAILRVLHPEAVNQSEPEIQMIRLGLTAALRARPEGAGKVVASYLTHTDPRVRADAANALTRLRANDGNEQLLKILTTDADPVVRANAARALGATEEKAAFEALLSLAANDPDARVRVSAIRSVGSLNDGRAAKQLVARGSQLLSMNSAKNDSVTGSFDIQNELLEIASALPRDMGETLGGDEAKAVWSFLMALRQRVGSLAPEVEIALAKISAGDYLADLGNGLAVKRKVQTLMLTDWRQSSSLAQGLGEIAKLPGSIEKKAELAQQSVELLRAMLDYRASGININTLINVHSEYAVPDVLRAFAAFKPDDLNDVLRKHLGEQDVITRATAAELLGELPPERKNLNALGGALIQALTDSTMNDAVLAVLEALAKQKGEEANSAMRAALESRDIIVRRRTVALLKANGSVDFSSRIGTVKSTNTAPDYQRAIARVGKGVRANIATTRGSFTILFLPEDAPLTVDNFLQLAKSGYFNGIVFHRVVPNFVIQGGDPRGDGNGGPGYQIRCEINQVPYDRGAVGMALSGKDTGGSQWFVTHSPQPHLDGGYTVFGRVVAGMDVVDSIARGDSIRTITITERMKR